MNLHDTFEKFNDEYLEFELIDNPAHPRPDICAFLLLHKLLPGNKEIVSAAEHDVIYLGIDCEELARIITDEQVRYLTRCGVIYGEDSDSLYMNV